MPAVLRRVHPFLFNVGRKSTHSIEIDQDCYKGSIRGRAISQYPEQICFQRDLRNVPGMEGKSRRSAGQSDS